MKECLITKAKGNTGRIHFASLLPGRNKRFKKRFSKEYEYTENTSLLSQCVPVEVEQEARSEFIYLHYALSVKSGPPSNESPLTYTEYIKGKGLTTLSNAISELEQAS
jgi:hypothetical protein